MKMKISIVTVVAMFAIFSCNSRHRDYEQKEKPPIKADYEIYSLYHKNDSVIHIARAVEKERNVFELSIYGINTKTGYQQLDTMQKLNASQLEVTRSAIAPRFGWSPPIKDQILFVQIQPAYAEDDLATLDLRQEVEEEIDKALNKSDLGSWTAGDLGPGGGNMLFTVKDINKSLQAILEVLQNYNLENKVRVGKRIMIDAEDWTYLVIYPAGFSGEFDTR